MTSTRALHTNLNRIMGSCCYLSLDASGTLTVRGHNLHDAYSARTVVEAYGFVVHRTPGSRTFTVVSKDEA